MVQFLRDFQGDWYAKTGVVSSAVVAAHDRWRWRLVADGRRDVSGYR
jgi:hypothetical protein